ncbi:uncharacterized protein LOC117893535 [Drosophila subobscura]|uniref:uncharacterized protein LOC117893535 n=1 Tax=Drosophila subobscura TaxID=7241 RepID=UPI00155A7846|nr:uncharacterized protein LOC117893535 [Drosophila subobscura]
MNKESDAHVSEAQASEVYELMEVDEDTDSEEEELLTSGEQKEKNDQQPEVEQETLPVAASDPQPEDPLENVSVGASEQQPMSEDEQEILSLASSDHQPMSEDEQEALPVAASAQATNKSLFKLAMDTSINQETIATEWVEMYKESRSTALLRLMQLLVEASGSQYVIPADTAAPFKYMDILLAATHHFACVSIEIYIEYF